MFLHRKLSRSHSFSKPIAVYRGEYAADKIIKAIFEIFQEWEYCKKVMKKHFNKNLIMIEKEENSIK